MRRQKDMEAHLALQLSSQDAKSVTRVQNPGRDFVFHFRAKVLERGMNPSIPFFLNRYK